MGFALKRVSIGVPIPADEVKNEKNFINYFDIDAHIYI